MTKNQTQTSNSEVYPQDTEQIILEAAYEEFLEKGYDGAKMMSIARRAGVAHSMLHYYFRSKEKLFLEIIHSHALKYIYPQIQASCDSNCSLRDVILKLRRSQFELMKKDPRLPVFILTQVLVHEDLCQMIVDFIYELSDHDFPEVNKRFKEAISAGEIINITLPELMLFLISVEASTFSAVEPMKQIQSLPPKVIDRLLEERHSSNSKFILETLLLH